MELLASKLHVSPEQVDVKFATSAGSGAVGLYKSRFGVPAGFPVITPPVALLRIQLATTSDGASPNVALYSAATPVTCGAANEVPVSVLVQPWSHVDLMSSPGA